MKAALGLIGLVIVLALAALSMRQAVKEVAAPAVDSTTTPAARVQAYERQLKDALDAGASARASAADR